jgi:transcriptional repressor NrdR
LDLVAYLRFASVYRAFDSLADFEAEITALRAFGDEPGPARTEPTGLDPAPAHHPAAPGDDLVGAGSGP